MNKVSGPMSIKTYNNTADAKNHMLRLMSQGKNASTVGDKRGSTVVVRPGSLSKSQIDSAKKTIMTRKNNSLGADKTKGLDPKFSSRVRKQNQKGKTEAANILKQASDQKLNRPPPNNKGLKKLPRGVRNKMGFKKAGGIVKNRNMGGVIGGGLGSQDVVNYLYDYKS
jgi:hypothetical protein